MFITAGLNSLYLPVLLTRPQNTVIYFGRYTSKEVQSAMIPSWGRLGSLVLNISCQHDL